MTATGGDDWENFYSVIEETGLFNAGVFIAYTRFIEIAVMNILNSTAPEPEFSLFAWSGTCRQLEGAVKDTVWHQASVGRWKPLYSMIICSWVSGTLELYSYFVAAVILYWHSRE